MYRKTLMAVFLLLLVGSALVSGAVARRGSTGASGEAAQRISSALCDLYDLVKSIFGPLIVAIVVLAAVIYAGGHVLGQEMGARAKSWALNLIVYTIIGVILFIILPYLLGKLVPSLDLEKTCG